MKKLLKVILPVLLLTGGAITLASCDSDPIQEIAGWFTKDEKVGTTIDLSSEDELEKIYLNNDLTRKEVKNVLKTLSYNEAGVYNVGLWSNANGSGAYYLNITNVDGIYKIVDSNEVIYYVSEDVDECEFVGWNEDVKSTIEVNKKTASSATYTLFGIDESLSGKQNTVIKDIISSAKFAKPSTEKTDNTEEAK
ncbi:MAG: hypothetical protein ACI311_06765 [Bacilli bacterium]